MSEFAGRYDQDHPFGEEPKRRSHRREAPISDLDLGDEFTFRRLAAIDRYAKPLVRLLRRRAGRPWCEVVSEIEARCRALKLDQDMRREVRNRVLGQVTTD